MSAYKFLRAGAIGPFSGYAWPTPANGEPARWIGAAGGLEPCRNGVHAFKVEDLPYWLDDELWELELGGAILQGENVLVAERGRLVTRIEAWNGDAALAFARACAERTRALGESSNNEHLTGYVGDIQRYAPNAARPRIASLISFIAASAAEAVRPGIFEEERAWQAQWLARRLGL